MPDLPLAGQIDRSAAVSLVTDHHTCVGPPKLWVTQFSQDLILPRPRRYWGVAAVRRKLVILGINPYDFREGLSLCQALHNRLRGINGFNRYPEDDGWAWEQRNKAKVKGSCNVLWWGWYIKQEPVDVGTSKWPKLELKEREITEHKRIKLIIEADTSAQKCGRCSIQLMPHPPSV